MCTFPHSAQTWTRGPWVCKCFRIAELSRNIFVQPWKTKEPFHEPYFITVFKAIGETALHFTCLTCFTWFLINIYRIYPCLIRTLILTTSFQKKKRIHNKDHLLTLHFCLFNPLELGIHRSRHLQLFLITLILTALLVACISLHLFIDN